MRCPKNILIPTIIGVFLMVFSINVEGQSTSGIGNDKIILSKGNSAVVQFDKGIAQLGGIKNFVKKGQKIVIKPAMSWDQIPGNKINTSPELVEHIINLCYEAKARQVVVFDHTVDQWTKCYKNSGIERVAKDARARVMPANDERYYTTVFLEEPSILKSVKIHQSILEADVVINLSVLKRHAKINMSAGISNLMGCAWDWDFYNSEINSCLAEFLYYTKPSINVIECFQQDMLLENVGSDIQIIATDIVAADVVAAELCGQNPLLIDYIQIANKLNFGNSIVEDRKLIIK